MDSSHVQRRLMNLEALIERLLSSRVPAKTVIEHKLDAMEELIVSLDSRRLASEWRNRLAILWEQFAEDEEDEDEADHDCGSIHNDDDHTQSEISEVAANALQQLPTLLAIIAQLFTLRPIPRSMIREKLYNMEQLIVGLGEHQTEANKWRGYIAELWTKMAIAEGPPLMESTRIQVEDEETWDVGLEGDEDQQKEDQTNLLYEHLMARLANLSVIECTDIKPYQTGFPELSQLTTFVHNAFDQITASASVSTEHQNRLIQAILAKLPADRQAHFTVCYPGTPTLLNLWKYLNNWLTIRTQFEMARLLSSELKTEEEAGAPEEPEPVIELPVKQQPEEEAVLQVEDNAMLQEQQNPEEIIEVVDNGDIDGVEVLFIASNTNDL